MTPYREVAKAALINWNGLSEEEATKIASTESVENLENQVWAMSSVKSAAQRLGHDLLLTDEETIEFENAVINGPEDASIFEVVSKRAEQVVSKETLVLRSLSHIHDNWVKDNSSEKTFEKKKDREQLRQYLPLELIGFNEVKSDLLFLTPILNSIGLSIDEKQLKETYDGYLRTFCWIQGTDIEKVIEKYPALSEEMIQRLIPLSEIITKQMKFNWRENDQRSFDTFFNTHAIQMGWDPTYTLPGARNGLTDTSTLLEGTQVLLETPKQEQDLSSLSMEQLKELQETGKVSITEEVHINTRAK